MIALSSPVLQAAALVAGSITPGMPGAAAGVEAAPVPAPTVEGELSVPAEPVAPPDVALTAPSPPAPVPPAEQKKSKTRSLETFAARSAISPNTDATPPETSLLANATTRRLASAFNRLKAASDNRPTQFELPLELAQADNAPPAAEAPSPAPANTALPAAAMPDQPPVAATPSSNADEALLPGRRRPGKGKILPEKVTQENLGAVRPPPPQAFPEGSDFPLPDRWRLVKSLCPDQPRFPGIEAVCHSRLDPYNQNPLKGDFPISLAGKPKWFPLKDDDWFLTLNGISDSVFEPRSFPVPVSPQIVSNPNTLNAFGGDRSIVASQTFLFGAVLVKGSTAYKPPEIEYHLTLAYNINYTNVQERGILNVKSTAPTHRTDEFLGVQEAFVDYHIRNVSDRYDFDSIRVGIQPFNADFRGFLFQDNQLGVRLFGNRDNNRFQYNLAVFRRLEKDTNSGLNSVVQTPRKDYVFIANLFRQDLPVPGLTSQVTVVYNMNREKGSIHVDDNGFPVRPELLGNLEPRDYDVVYLGYNADGHIGRVNLTTSFYGAFGRDSNSFFTGKPATIRAFFGAAELSYDINWVRVRLSGLYASGDHNPSDNKETGFDSIFENPIFAGADTSYWIRQSIPFAGGGRVVSVNQRNGLLADLRSSKDEGQSNFNNPGTILLGTGADFDITPKLRVSANVNHLWFENTSNLQELRNEGSIPRSIGFDYSIAAVYRPKMIQNVVLRLSGAMLDPGAGFRDLFANSNGDNRYYSVLFNVILAF